MDTLLTSRSVLKEKHSILITCTLRKTKEPLNNCLCDQTVTEDLKQVSKFCEFLSLIF